MCFFINYMKWNSFSLISPAIGKTKEMLFPFRFWEWFKLMIISLLSASRGGGNFNSFRSAGDFGSSGTGSGTGSGGTSFSEFLDKARQGIKDYWIIGALIFGVLFVIIQIISYIQSVFTFIFIDSLVNKKAKFTFGKNHSKGVSLFFFKFIISIISILILGALASPYAYHFMKANPVVQSVGIGYIIFSIAAAIIYIIFLWILFLFLHDLTVPYMYVKNTSAGFSLKQIWSSIKKNKLATFVYWLSRIVLGIAIGIAAIVVIIVLGLAGLLVGGILFLIGFLLYKLIGLPVLFIALAIIFGVILFVIFLLALGMFLLPFSVFRRYYEMLNFENLTDIKIFTDRSKNKKEK